MSCVYNDAPCILDTAQFLVTPSPTSKPTDTVVNGGSGSGSDSDSDDAFSFSDVTGAGSSDRVLRVSLIGIAALVLFLLFAVSVIYLCRRRRAKANAEDFEGINLEKSNDVEEFRSRDTVGSLSTVSGVEVVVEIEANETTPM